MLPRNHRCRARPKRAASYFSLPSHRVHPTRLERPLTISSFPPLTVLAAMLTHRLRRQHTADRKHPLFARTEGRADESFPAVLIDRGDATA